MEVSFVGRWSMHCSLLFIQLENNLSSQQFWHEKFYTVKYILWCTNESSLFRLQIIILDYHLKYFKLSKVLFLAGPWGETYGILSVNSELPCTGFFPALNHKDSLISYFSDKKKSLIILVLTDKMSLRPLFLVKIHFIKHYLPKVIKTESRSDLDLCVYCTKVTRVRPSAVVSPQSVPAVPVWNSSHLLVHHLLWKWLIKTRESQPSTEVGFKFPLQRHVKKKKDESILL